MKSDWHWLMLLPLALLVACGGDPDTQHTEAQITKEHETPAPSTLNLYVAGPDRILIDTREVNEETLISEVEEAVRQAKAGATQQVTIHLNARTGVRYVYYRKVLHRLQEIVDREQALVSQDKWNKTPERLSTEELAQLEALSPVLLIDHK
ncbi:MAG: hypothetical protein R3301_05370 [Saprospiraceae bacterium]|nr:hypothetical protein [Saprospiraceae bacterium]